MNRVFGKKKAPRPTAPAPTINDATSGLGKRVESLDAKIAALDKELSGYKTKLKTTKNAAAKKNLQKRAMETLKRKRMFETQRDQICGQQFNLDQAQYGIESAQATVASVAAMKQANTQLKQAIGKDLNVDDIDDLAEDMAEMMDEINQVNEVMGTSFATPEYVDEADLEAELEMLDDELEEEFEDATPSYLQADSLPAHPTAAPGSKIPARNRVDEYGLPVTD